MPKKSVIRVIVVTSFNLGLLVVAVVLAVCLFTGCEDLFPKPEVKYDINGTWNLKTLQGAPVSIIGASGTLVIVDAATYTQQLTLTAQLSGTPVTGTVVKVTDKEYDLTQTGGTDAVRYTFSDDGKTLTCTTVMTGEMTFGK